MGHPDYESSSKRENPEHISFKTSEGTGREYGTSSECNSVCGDNNDFIASSSQKKESENKVDSELLIVVNHLREENSRRKCYRNLKTRRGNFDTLNTVISKKEITSDAPVPLVGDENKLLTNVQGEVNICNQLDLPNIDVAANNKINTSAVLKLPFGNISKGERYGSNTGICDSLKFCDILDNNPSKSENISSRLDASEAPEILTKNMGLSENHDRRLEMDTVTLRLGEEKLPNSHSEDSCEQTVNNNINRCNAIENIQNSNELLETALKTVPVKVNGPPQKNLKKKHTNSTIRVCVKENKELVEKTESKVGATEHPSRKIRRIKTSLQSTEEPVVPILNLKKRVKTVKSDSMDKFVEPLKQSSENKGLNLKNKNLDIRKSFKKKKNAFGIIHPILNTSKTFKRGQKTIVNTEPCKPKTSLKKYYESKVKSNSNGILSSKLPKAIKNNLMLNKKNRSLKKVVFKPRMAKLSSVQDKPNKFCKSDLKYKKRGTSKGNTCENQEVISDAKNSFHSNGDCLIVSNSIPACGETKETPISDSKKSSSMLVTEHFQSCKDKETSVDPLFQDKVNPDCQENHSTESQNIDKVLPYCKSGTISVSSKIAAENEKTQNLELIERLETDVELFKNGIEELTASKCFRRTRQTSKNVNEAQKKVPGKKLSKTKVHTKNYCEEVSVSGNENNTDIQNKDTKFDEVQMNNNSEETAPVQNTSEVVNGRKASCVQSTISANTKIELNPEYPSKTSLEAENEVKAYFPNVDELNPVCPSQTLVKTDDVETYLDVAELNPQCQTESLVKVNSQIETKDEKAVIFKKNNKELKSKKKMVLENKGILRSNKDKMLTLRKQNVGSHKHSKNDSINNNEGICSAKNAEIEAQVNPKEKDYKLSHFDDPDKGKPSNKSLLPSTQSVIQPNSCHELNTQNSSELECNKQLNIKSKKELRKENILESVQSSSKDKVKADSQIVTTNKLGGRQRSFPKLPVRMKIGVDQQCCGHWFPTRKSYLLHLTELSTEPLNALHAAKLIDMDMQKCTICSIWISYQKMKRHLRIDHGIFKCVQESNVIKIDSNVVDKRKKRRENSADSVAQINKEIVGNKKFVGSATPVDYSDDNKVTDKLQLSRPCPMSKKRKSDASEGTERITCDLREDPKFLKPYLTITSVKDLPIHLKPIVKLQKYKVFPKKKKKRTVRKVPLVKGQKISKVKVKNNFIESNLNSDSSPMVDAASEKDVSGFPSNGESAALKDKSNLLNKVDGSETSAVGLVVGKNVSKFEKIFNAVLKKTSMKNSSFGETVTSSPLPLHEKNNERTLESVPLSTRNRNSLSSSKNDSNSITNKTLRTRRNSRQSIDVTPQNIMKARPLGRIRIRGRPRKLTRFVRKRDKRRRCGFHSSETSDAETSNSSASDYENDYFDDDQKENEENIPIVELDLFTISSGDEEVSILLIDPNNPNFKVFASMDAIFVGDSALGDVTNQVGYVTDKNNVVYVNPGHFLFPKIENSENEDLKQGKNFTKRSTPKISKLMGNELTSIVSSLNKYIKRKDIPVASSGSCEGDKESLCDAKENLINIKENHTNKSDLMNVDKETLSDLKENIADQENHSGIKENSTDNKENVIAVGKENLDTTVKDNISNIKEILTNIKSDLCDVEQSSTMEKVSHNNICSRENVESQREKIILPKATLPVVRSMISIPAKLPIKKKGNNIVNSAFIAHDHEKTNLTPKKNESTFVEQPPDDDVCHKSKTPCKIIIKSSLKKRKIIVRSNTLGSTAVVPPPVRNPNVIVIKTSSKKPLEVKRDENNIDWLNKRETEKNLKLFDSELENGKNKSTLWRNLKDVENRSNSFKLDNNIEEFQNSNDKIKVTNDEVIPSVISPSIEENALNNVISLEEAIATLAPPSTDETVIQTLSLNTCHLNQDIDNEDKYSSYKLLADSSNTNLCYDYTSIPFNCSNMEDNRFPFAKLSKDDVSTPIIQDEKDFTPNKSTSDCLDNGNKPNVSESISSPVQLDSLEPVQVMGESQVVVATAKILSFETLEGGLCLEDVLEEKTPYFPSNNGIEDNNDENKDVNDENKVVNDENKGVNDENKVVNNENKGVNDENKVVNDENKVVNDENKVIASAIDYKNETINKGSEDGVGFPLKNEKEMLNTVKHINENKTKLPEIVSKNLVSIFDTSSSDSEISVGNYEDLPSNFNDLTIVDVVKGSSLWDTPLLFSPHKFKTENDYVPEGDSKITDKNTSLVLNQNETQGIDKLIKTEEPSFQDDLLGIPFSQIPDFLSPTKTTPLTGVNDANQFMTKSPVQLSPNTLSNILSPGFTAKNPPLCKLKIEPVGPPNAKSKGKVLNYKTTLHKTFCKKSLKSSICKEDISSRNLAEKTQNGYLPLNFGCAKTKQTVSLTENNTVKDFLIKPNSKLKEKASRMTKSTSRKSAGSDSKNVIDSTKCVEPTRVGMITNECDTDPSNKKSLKMKISLKNIPNLESSSSSYSHKKKKKLSKKERRKERRSKVYHVKETYKDYSLSSSCKIDERVVTDDEERSSGNLPINSNLDSNVIIKNENLSEGESCENIQSKQIVLKQFDSVPRKRMSPSKNNTGSPKKVLPPKYEDRFSVESCTDLTSMKINVRESDSAEKEFLTRHSNSRENDPDTEREKVRSINSTLNNLSNVLDRSPSPRKWLGRGAKLKAQVLIQDQQFGVTDSKVIHEICEIKTEKDELDTSLLDVKPLVDQQFDERHWHSRGAKLKAKILISDHQKGISNSTVKEEDCVFSSTPIKISSSPPVAAFEKSKLNGHSQDIRSYFSAGLDQKYGDLEISPLISPPLKHPPLKSSPSSSQIKSPLSQSLHSSSSQIMSPLSKSLNTSFHSLKSPAPIFSSNKRSPVVNPSTKTITRRNVKHFEPKEDIRKFLSKKRKPKSGTGSEFASKRPRVTNSGPCRSEPNTFEGFETCSRFSGLRSKILLRFVDVLDTTTWFNCDRYPLPIDQLCDWDDDQLNVYLFEKG